LSIAKRIDLIGRVNAEFRVDALNVFNHVNFAPVSGVAIGSTTSNNINFNRSTGSNPVSFEVTQLVTGTQARIVQLVSRIRW
jgi:hypothetical protein